MATTKQISSFIEKIAPVIKKYCRIYGYRYPSAIIAQACLESNYGLSTLALYHHNYFGMKCGTSWKGKSVNLATKEEYRAGTLVNIRDNFRCYSNLDAGVEGYFMFIQLSRYSNLRAASSPKDYLQKIKDDGYATSSSYVKNVYAIVEKYDLTQYDLEDKRKTNEQIAKEVIAGKWGNGASRKAKLIAAGYDADAIQKLVNKMLK